MTTAAGAPLRTWFDYPRLRQACCRVLLLQPHYHLAAELERALASLGHAVAGIAVPPAGAADGGWVREMLLAAARHRPDFLLTVNQFGFDDRGALAGLLAELRLPCAVWYVDDPVAILGGTGSHGNGWTSGFVCERSWTPALQAAGFDHVEHLPLGLDASRLQPPAAAAEPRWPIVFVGDSLVETRMKWGRRLGAGRRRQAAAAVARLAADARLGDAELLQSSGAEAAPAPVRADMLGYVRAAASGEWRRTVLAALPPALLHVFGDPAWSRLLPLVRCHPATDYRQQTAAVYRAAGVVVNVTGRQMPTAVNQRVFDVPAAGGCLLTDAQDDLSELFAEAGELATYRTPAEAAAQAAWLLANPAERRRLGDRLRAVIVARHCYEHRLHRLVAVMRDRYG